MFVTRDLDTATIALGKRAIIIEAVTLALAILSLSLRLWARKINKRSLCLNDYLIVLALVDIHSGRPSGSESLFAGVHG